MKPSRYNIAAVVLLVAGTAFALVHGIVGLRYAGSTPQEYAGLFLGASRAVDFFLAGLWGVGAFALMFRKSVPSFVVAGLGALAMLAHGFLFSLATKNPVGLVFMVASLALAFLLKRAWGKGEGSPLIESPRPSRLSWNS